MKKRERKYIERRVLIKSFEKYLRKRMMEELVKKYDKHFEDICLGRITQDYEDAKFRKVFVGDSYF